MRCFSDFGAIKNIRVQRNDAIITFENADSASRSLDKSGILLQGKRIEVTLAASLFVSFVNMMAEFLMLGLSEVATDLAVSSYSPPLLVLMDLPDKGEIGPSPCFVGKTLSIDFLATG